MTTPVESTESGPVVLGIEMSNPSAGADRHSVALWNDRGGELALLASAPMPKGERGSDGVMALVQQLCDEQGVVPARISKILVSAGPGGYTALRIAATTAKVLAQTLGCALIAVESARVAARAIEPSSRPALVALASKKGRTHATLVDVDGALTTLGIVDESVLAQVRPVSVVGDGHLPPAFAREADRLGIGLSPIRLDARDLAEAARGLEAVDPGAMSPIYAREPDAVTQWRARGVSGPSR